MEFQLLGTFEARHAGGGALPGVRRQERLLLAFLLLDAGRTVPVDRLVELLWQGRPPGAARGTVHTYIGRLRAALGPYGLRLTTHDDGYRAERDEHRIDTAEFTGLLRRAAQAGDPAHRVELHDRALALWRGPLLDGLADEPLRARLGGVLAEQRLTALERRAEDLLAMGSHHRVVADLMPEMRGRPPRERLVLVQMTALYRSGRTAEALDLYRDTRTALVDELGLEPGAELRELHRRILAGDPRLDRPPGPVYAVRVRDVWLPWNTSGHPALEFCNTYAGWGSPALPGADWLARYASLAVWAGHLGLADDRTVDRLLTEADRDPGPADAALAEARALRAALYACCTDRADTGAFKTVAAAAEEAAAHAEFTRGPDGLGRWTVSPATGLRLPLLAAAHSAAGLLASPRVHTLRVCPGKDCGWLFLDESGRRRWCSLGTCGAVRPSP
ncbi:ABATE domain-containing protein [Streptomyces sp. TRM66268-LWL]|uniref:ABATE domain-containing protein n=1 Tax=Streptomyces polyasparticus TaxID=2767826 RepID=A0ABR7SP82_9ACTN|nr:AfsR/SARP family transcriptional regulator [Streptomyces polyasparticus]MBC9717169.1 ABATE domain-containing protein [Streptomyces polyasparticus]